MQPLQPGLTLGKWVLGRELGKGEFGQVFETTGPAGEKYAIKVCRLQRGPGERKVKGLTQSDGAIGLAVERRIHEVQLKGLPHVPALPPNCYKDVDGYRYLVMQAMSCTLTQKAAEVGGKFHLQAVAYVCKALLETLQSAHTRGFVFSDLKPSNVMFGQGPKADWPYLLDWGCCRTYVDMRGNMLEAGNEMGNDMFRSRANQSLSPPAPRDDLEGLGYVMVWMATGRLPWTDAHSRAELLRIKNDTSDDALCAGLPDFMQAFVKKVRNLGLVHGRDVDYAGLFALLAPHLPPASAAITWKAPAVAPAATASAASKRKPKAVATAAAAAAAPASKPKKAPARSKSTAAKPRKAAATAAAAAAAAAAPSPPASPARPKATSAKKRARAASASPAAAPANVRRSGRKAK